MTRVIGLAGNVVKDNAFMSKAEKLAFWQKRRRARCDHVSHASIQGFKEGVLIFSLEIMWQTTWRAALIWAVEAEVENDLEPYDACLFTSCGIYMSMPLVYYSRYSKRIWVYEFAQNGCCKTVSVPCRHVYPVIQMESSSMKVFGVRANIDQPLNYERFMAYEQVYPTH